MPAPPAVSSDVAGEPGGAPRAWAGVLLTGGRGRRLGGVDKAALRHGGLSLLERGLTALAGAERTVVVGPRTATSRPVEFAVEKPAGGGPAAGLLAAVDVLADGPPLVVVLAVDMAWVEAATVARLLAGLTPEVDGAALDDGRRQPLAAAYRLSSLRSLPAPAQGSAQGLSVHRLLAPLRLARVPARAGEAHDIDTPDDLHLLDG
ncbi:molybdenum cofactor guanylyltransferase [Nocardioides mangrovicus]|uniref:molybdenum cofactor guanylyltransferase n=1 Tax=Nocardioides mangrovicus TaxID=2478913 RepID=UPI001314AE70|nr:NTP transferase domain-containing protein [Nocardioides mangrovicus]